MRSISDSVHWMAISMRGMMIMELIHQLMDKVTNRKLNLYTHPTEPVYLSRVVKQPLLPGFVLVGHHGLGHLVSDRGAHAVQNPVQPHLHLTPHTRAEVRGHIGMCVT